MNQKVIAWLDYAGPTWMIPALLVSCAAVLAQWDTKKPLYLKEVLQTILLGLIAGYATNKVCLLCGYGGLKITVVTLFTSFFARFIGQLLIKNKWIILKAKTGLNGGEEEK